MDGRLTVKTFFAQPSLEQPAKSVSVYVEGLLSQLGQPGHYVEVHIYPTKSAMKTALLTELEQLEIPTRLVVPDFATFHEAFAGYPRIWISSEDADLDNPISRGRLQHEVGHAVLHWEISAYLLGLPPSLRALVEAGKMSQGDASVISYVISIGVKDFEVSMLLDRSGIRHDQKEFYLQELGQTEHEVEGVLGALNDLKVIMAAYPFRKDQGIMAAIDGAVRRLGVLSDVAGRILSDLDANEELDLQERIGLVSKAIASGMGV